MVALPVAAGAALGAAFAWGPSPEVRTRVGARWRLPRGRRRRPPVATVGLVVAVASLGATVIAMSVLVVEGPGTRALQTRGATASATVVEARFSDGTTEAVHVSFDAAGQTVVADLEKYDGIPSTERAGDRVEVLYDPRNPSYVIVDGQLDVADAQEPALATGGFAGLSLAGVTYWTLRSPRRRMSAGF